MRTLLSLSVAVLAGLLMTRVAKPLKLPSVTAYLVAGVTFVRAAPAISAEVQSITLSIQNTGTRLIIISGEQFFCYR